MTRTLFALRSRISCALGLVALTCGAAASSTSQDAPIAPPVMEALPPPLAIDGQDIPWTEFGGWLVLLQGRSNTEAFIVDHLLDQECDRLGVRIDENALLFVIDEGIEARVLNTFGGDRSQWIDELERLGTSVEMFRSVRLREERRQSKIDRLSQLQRTVDEAEVRRHWEADYGVDGKALRVSHLFIKVKPPEQPPGITRDESQALNEKAKQEALAFATDLHKRLSAGGKFEEVVREFSDDATTRSAGGRMDEPLDAHAWPGLNRAEVFGLAPGGLTQPFFSKGGYNIFRLDSVSVTPFEDVQLQIERKLLEAPADLVETQELRSGLLDSTRIEVLAELDRPVDTDSPRLDRPVLMLDDKPVTRRSFTRWLIHERGEPLARTFMEHRHFAMRARDAKLEPTSIEVEQRVQEDLEHQIEAFFRGDREAWLADLAASGRTVEDVLHLSRQRVRHNLRAERCMLRERVIDEAMLRGEWQERYGVGGNSLDIRYIVRNVPIPAEGVLTTDEEAREYVKRETQVALEFLATLRTRVQNGEDFQALARTYSEEPESRDRGGRPPGRFLIHEWPEDVQLKLRALEIGQVAAPVALSTTFFLFELAGRKYVPFDEVQAELAEDLRTRRPSQAQVSGSVNQECKGIEVTIKASMYN